MILYKYNKRGDLFQEDEEKTFSAPDMGTGSDAAMNIDLSLGYSFGFALSIKRESDGVGGKFILSQGITYVVNDVSLDAQTDFDEVFDDLDSLLSGSTPGTLYVYNDSDELIGEYEVTPNELGFFF